MSRSIKISVVFIAIVTFAHGAVAQSQPGVGLRVVRVVASYGDLNLNNARDAHLMLARITHFNQRPQIGTKLQHVKDVVVTGCNN
jgi:hypothetical protein